MQILTEHITIEDEPIRITPRNAAFLAFLSRYRRGVSREEIQDALWPDLDERAARDALYNCLYRLRKRTKTFELVENLGNAYRFAPHVAVDIWDYELLAQRVLRDPATPAAEIHEAFSKIAKRSYPHLLGYDWFSAIDFQIRECLRILSRQPYRKRDEHE